MRAVPGRRLLGAATASTIAAMAVCSGASVSAAHAAAPVPAAVKAAEAPDAPVEPVEPGQAPPVRPDGQKPKGPKAPDEPIEPPDRKAPAPPRLGTPSVGPDGQVQVDVVAEKDSRLSLVERRDVDASQGSSGQLDFATEPGVVVDAGDRQILRDIATGQSQSLAWTAEHGEHAYEVVATDDAGNTSTPTAFEVDVDAKAPRPKRFVVTAGTATDSRSTVGLRTEAGATYQLLVDGSLVDSGTADGLIRNHVDVADGTHEVVAVLTDEVGNQRVVTRTLEVSIPTLSVDADILTESTQTIRVRTTPNATGTLHVPGLRERELTFEDGTAEVSVRLEDGTYEAPRVTVTDTHGRRGTARLPDITVDTSGPGVVVTADKEAAARGLLSFTVEGEDGDTVTWRALNDDRVISASGELTVRAEPTSVTRDVAEGRYEVEVTVTDPFGRTAVERLTVGVAAEAVSAGRIVLLVVGVAGAVLATVAAGAAAMRRRKRRPGASARRWAARLRRSRRAGGAQTSDVASAYAEADAQWRRRRDALAQLLASVRHVVEAEPAPGGRRQETSLFTAPARLLEARVQDGEQVFAETDSGEITITDCGVSFTGTRRRDWVFDPLDRVRHVAHDRTLVKGVQDDDWWGFAYADPEITRLSLDFAMTDRSAAREAFVSSLAQWSRQHEMRRPVPPTPDADQEHDAVVG